MNLINWLVVIAVILLFGLLVVFAPAMAEYGGAFNLLFSGVVSVATAIYAVLTSKLVQETRSLREAQTEPRVEVFLRIPDEWIRGVNIVVKNIGAGPAYALRFDITAANPENTATPVLLGELNEINSVSSGMSFLGPGQEFSSFWTNMNEGFEAKSKARLIFKSACHSATGRSYNREHVIDFSELRGIQRLGEPPLLKITRLMERMESHVARVVNASSSLKVNVYDSEDRELERKRWEEEREKLASPSKAE